MWHTCPQTNQTGDFSIGPKGFGFLVDLWSGIIATKSTVDVDFLANLNGIKEGGGGRGGADSLPDFGLWRDFVRPFGWLVCSEQSRFISLRFFGGGGGNESVFGCHCCVI